jgi:hypothetical protein
VVTILELKPPHYLLVAEVVACIPQSPVLDKLDALVLELLSFCRRKQKKIRKEL